MATFIKRDFRKETPLFVKIIWFIVILFFTFLVIYPATQGAVFNTKTMRLEIPKNK